MPELAEDARELFELRGRRDGWRRARAWYRKQARASLRRSLFVGRRRRRVTEGGLKGDQAPARGSALVSWLDLKLALRMVAKYPGLSLVSVVGMSVSIAIGAGGFGFVRTMLDGDLPLPDGDRVVAVQNADVRVDGSRNGHALHDFYVWRDELRSVVDLSAFAYEDASLQGPDGVPTTVRVASVTASGFRALRTSPALGRALLEEDERPGAPPVVVIGYDEWQRRFEADPDVIGRYLRLGTSVPTVVGVMPEGFRFPVNDGYWTPWRLDPTAFEVGAGPSITVFGRLADGVTLEQAQAELTAVSDRLTSAYPRTHEFLRAQVLPYTDAFIGVNSPQRMLLVRTIQLALSLLLIVVAANVAILIYARTTVRMGEIAVRTALGASRRRVLTQLFMEALTLSTVAAAIGLGLAVFGFHWFEGLLNREDTGELLLPFWSDFGLSPALVAYTLGMAVAAAFIMGVLPALKATGGAVQRGLRALHSGGSGLQLGRTWTALIVTQVGIAVAVLPYALHVLGPSISRGFAEPDYPVASFLQASLALDEGAAAALPEREDAAQARLLDGATALVGRIEADPAVEGVAFSTHFPGTEAVARVELEGIAGSAAVWENQVSTDLFVTYGVPILTGRGFSEADAAPGSRSVIVDRVFAEQLFGNANVLGRRVRLPEPSSGAEDSDRQGPWLEIVGVVPDFTVPPAFQPEAPKLYRPIGLSDAGEVLRLSVRLRDDARSQVAMGRLRAMAEAVAPDLRLRLLTTASAAEQERTVGLRLIALVILAVMGSVLLLSGAGVYAMMSFIVASRRRELGIRAALGAAPTRLLAGTFRRAGVQLGTGVVAGLGLAEGVAHVAGVSLLFGGEQPYLLPTVALTLAAVGLLATAGPALQGLAVQPNEALRGE